MSGEYQCEKREKWWQVFFTTIFTFFQKPIGVFFSVIVLLAMAIIFIPDLLKNYAYQDGYNGIGDFFNGIATPVLTLLAVFFAYLAFTKQGEQLKAHQEESNKQRIENIFFQLIKLHNDIVNSLEYTNTEGNKYKKGKEENTITFKVEESGKQKSNQDQKCERKDTSDSDLQIHFESALWSQQPKGRMYFKKVYYKLVEIYIDQQEDHKIGFQENILITSMNILDSSEKENFLHYYRNLYRLIKWVDGNKASISSAEQKEFIDIIKAQLSYFELSLLYFNTRFFGGQNNFYHLLKEYGFFDTDDDQQTILDRFKDDVQAHYRPCTPKTTCEEGN